MNSWKAVRQEVEAEKAGLGSTGITLPRGADAMHCPECDKKLVGAALLGREDAPLCRKCATAGLGHIPCCMICIRDGAGGHHCNPSMPNPECVGCLGVGWLLVEPLLRKEYCWDCAGPCVQCAVRNLMQDS